MSVNVTQSGGNYVVTYPEPSILGIVVPGIIVVTAYVAAHRYITQDSGTGGE